MAIYTETKPDSAENGRLQAELYKRLPQKYFPHFAPVTPEWNLEKETIGIMPAIENASSICSEDETLDLAFRRLESMKAAYISLTWNTENRFGGKELKPDGKTLLEFMNNRRIAIDLSHATDAMAHDIVNEIDRNKWNIPVVASHSNSRAVSNVPRNLPDELIREIVSRQGIIGLVFVKTFLGPGFEKQVEHLLHLGAENNIAFGADFFYDDGKNVRRPEGGWYYSEYEDATCYPRVLQMLGKNNIEKISHRNAMRFLKEMIL